MLYSRANIYFTLGSFVTVGIIVNINQMFMAVINADKTNELTAVFDADNRPVIKHRSADIKMKDRDLFFIFGRILYKANKAIYITVYFYFVPFLFFIFSYFAGI